MTKYLAIVGSKGGVGKTTMVINLGYALHNRGRDVIVLDGNLQSPGIGIHLGAPVVKVALHDVLAEKRSIFEATYLHPSGLRMIPGALDRSSGIDHSELQKAIKELDGAAEVVLIDTPPGFDKGFFDSVKHAEALVVTTPDLASVSESLRTIKFIERTGLTVIGVAVNKVVADRYDIRKGNIEHILEKPVIGIIPEDSNMRKALHLKNPVHLIQPYSASSRAFFELADLLTTGKK